MPQLIRLCYNWCYLGCFQSGTCCRLNVCVSLKFTFKQSPMWWHSGAGPLGGDCYEDAALVNGISALIKEPRDLLHASTTMWGHGKKVSSVNQKAAVPMCGICQHLRLGLPTSPSVRKKCLLFVSHSVYGSLLQQPERTAQGYYTWRHHKHSWPRLWVHTFTHRHRAHLSHIRATFSFCNSANRLSQVAVLTDTPAFAVRELQLLQVWPTLGINGFLSFWVGFFVWF